jgi:hypothetical protein
VRQLRKLLVVMFEHDWQQLDVGNEWGKQFEGVNRVKHVRARALPSIDMYLAGNGERDEAMISSKT